MLDCEHIFCRFCITEWLTNSDQCPYCKLKLKSKDFKQIPKQIANFIKKMDTIRNIYFMKPQRKVLSIDLTDSTDSNSNADKSNSEDSFLDCLCEDFVKLD